MKKVSLYWNHICILHNYEKMFLEEIPERPDNITGQKVRFELVKDIEKNYQK